MWRELCVCICECAHTLLPLHFPHMKQKVFPLWPGIDPCVPRLSKQRLCRCKSVHFKCKKRSPPYQSLLAWCRNFFLVKIWGARNSRDYFIKSLSSLLGLFFLESSAVIIDFLLGDALQSSTFAVDYPAFTLDQFSEAVCMTLWKQV